MADYVVSKELPWLQAATIQWLESILQPDWCVLETGCGGSTVFLARRCAMVISYEHDGRWFDQVADEVREQGLREKVSFRLDCRYPRYGLSMLPPLDFALIDGRGRV